MAHSRSSPLGRNSPCPFVLQLLFRDSGIFLEGNFWPCFQGMANIPQPSSSSPGHQPIDPTQVFDENKCRNVLVRYCAHIPRNYRYSDGIRLVFLVLRDHMGDEHLGLAAGVLYEMIEVDCHHSDDPGAAFQRWRHDHMNRHADLELPHVPHLTTVTSTIIPTATLTSWRKEHPHRYQTRLSDYSPTFERSSLFSSGIRTRKSWVIEYTMYVSSRNGGTRPFRQITAREFHEMQWNSNTNNPGRLVGEKSIDLGEFLRKRDIDEPGDDKCATTSRFSLSSRLFRGGSKMERVMNKLRAAKKSPLHQSGQTWSPSRPDCDATVSFYGVLEQRSNHRVSDWDIPNANFARKFGLYTDSGPLPPFIRELPVAEDKAMDLATGLAMRELVYSWEFQGPFTPQLWFDSGLDYRWKRASC
ncbi:hypothetical protein CDV36_008969 [Fusarium kuroshium]|uniref:Uncharacterized protein n=1 Tax=Fusarium kuroshium TaxID=2010991 RepID=A0A3M2S1E8_9HYPO|nr:hypothetical protein CDV36_008969 [Fusarium kuroshium]